MIKALIYTLKKMWGGELIWLHEKINQNDQKQDSKDYKSYIIFY